MRILNFMNKTRLFRQALGGELLSHNTYQNIVHNKANIDYCIDQFKFIESRISCIKLVTGRGPFLA